MYPPKTKAKEYPDGIASDTSIESYDFIPLDSMTPVLASLN